MIVEFVAVDNPHAKKLTVHILAVVAPHEGEMTAQRTKDALQAAKARVLCSAIPSSTRCVIAPSRV
jgi:DNA invertase Pin-like site-specific DNA recombinase